MEILLNAKIVGKLEWKLEDNGILNGVTAIIDTVGLGKIMLVGAKVAMQNMTKKII